MLKAVTFDFWNTLFVDTRGSERERRRVQVLAAELARTDQRLPIPVVEEALRTGISFFDEVWYNEHRTPTCAEIVDTILNTLGVRLPRDIVAEVVTQYEEMILELPPEPSPGAGRVVAMLAQQYRLGVICDTAYSPGRVLRQLLSRHFALHDFVYLFFSDEHGMSKPDIRVFGRTLTELHVDARQAAHVGDIQRTDIAGAQAAGMSAVHYIGANSHDAARSTAEVVVRRFDDIPRALGKLPRRRRR
ncbi:MAG: HAD family hydrolase [Thermoleophilia bacterium]